MALEVTTTEGPQNGGCVWRQNLYCIVAYLPFFTQTIQEATISKYPFFSRPDLVSETNVPWSVTAALSASVVSGPLLCLVADRLGRRYAVFAISAVQIMTTVTCILIVGNTTPIYLLPNILLGISAGGIYSVLPLYVREISDQTSSPQTTMMMVMTSLGQLMMMMQWEGKTMMYLQSGLVLTQFLMMFSLCETPSYLVMKDSEAVTKTLGHLHQASPDSRRVTEAVRRLRHEADNARAAGSQGVMGILRNRTWRNAAKLGIGLHTAFSLGGSDLLVRGGEVVRRGAAGGAAWAAAVPIGAAVGAAAAVVATLFVELKYILTSSFAVSTLALGILGIFMQADGGAPHHPWLSLSAAAANVIGYSVGWGLPYVLMTEVCNLEIRATIIGFLAFYSQGLQLIQVHCMDSVKGFVGVYVLCYMFAGINLFGGLYSLFGLPDVRHKSVARIEKQLMYIPAWKF